MLSSSFDQFASLPTIVITPVSQTKAWSPDIGTPKPLISIMRLDGGNSFPENGTPYFKAPEPTVKAFAPLFTQVFKDLDI